MRKVTLYIAASLDGYIADRNGAVDWLHGQDSGAEDLNTYPDFIKGMDTVVMGWNTYRQIVEELSPGAWVYSGLTSYVITHRELPATENIRFVHDDPCGAVQKLRREPGRGIWICGGASIVQPLVQADLIDEYDITVIPTLLGSGIRLWDESGNGGETKLRLVRTQSCNGMIELIYTRR